MRDEKVTAVVKKRDDIFADTIKTKIWSEKANPDNPYASDQCFIHGYDLLELASGIDFLDAIYLNLKGELPTQADKTLLNSIFVALSNLGPRHAATRAVMNAAVSKTKTDQLLPIGLALLSGDFGGSGEVENAVRFIRKHINQKPEEIAQDCLQTFEEKCTSASNLDSQPPTLVAPGFGRHFGSVDKIAINLALQLSQLASADRAIHWGMAFANALGPQQYSWRLPGIAAACFVDLAFTPKAAAGLFQLAATPGLLAHGLEMAPKPLTAMPFVDDTDYHYQKQQNGGEEDAE
jgi:citrate synthase